MKKLIKESTQIFDLSVWGITILFFIGSALLLGGDVAQSFLGASGIIILMFFVGFSIELILSALKDVKGVGKITGFITNGPEALVLLVGLISGDILFAASTPLGSNIMNPVLLLLAIVITGYLLRLKYFKYKLFFTIGLILTPLIAVSFFYFSEKYYLLWIVVSLIITFILFSKKFDEGDEGDEYDLDAKKYYLPLGFAILLVSGYFLDPVVSITAEASKAPKGLIGFLVLATLTSWPEFKSVIGLLRRNKVTDAFINILVSNITNIWLAIFGVVTWLLTK